MTQTLSYWHFYLLIQFVFEIFSLVQRAFESGERRGAILWNFPPLASTQAADGQQPEPEPVFEKSRELNRELL